MGLESYFDKEYKSARSSFTNRMNHLTKYFPSCKLTKEFVCATDKRDHLYVDIGYFPPETKENLLFIISGTHGIEGFAGSALQHRFFGNLLNEIDMKTTGVVLYHAFNPFGMHHFRRANENNADLNRSCFESENAPKTPYPELFESVYPILTPEHKLNSTDEMLYLLKSAWKIHETGRKITKSKNPYQNFKVGFQALKIAIGGGQYHRPDTIFYGASGQRSVEIFKETLQRFTPDFENLVLMDIHTGLGERYDYVPWTSLGKETKEFARLKKIDARFEASDSKEGESSYIKIGDVNRFAIEHSKAKNTIPFGIDFGTIDPQEITRILVRENQSWRYPGSKLDAVVRNEMMEAFCPPEVHWRENFIQKSEEFLERVAREFNMLKTG